MINLTECAGLLDEAPHCFALLEAWQRWRGEKLLPSSDEVIAEHLGAALGHVNVYDAFSPERVVFRLFAGCHGALASRDLTGQNYIEMLPEGERPTRIRRLWKLTSTPCGGLGDINIVRRSGLATQFKSLILPVAPAVSHEPMKLFAAADVYGETPRTNDKTDEPAPLAHAHAYIDLGSSAPE